MEKGQQVKYKTVTKGRGKTMIIGFGPGKQRKTEQTLNVWEGNKSGDIMQEILKGRKDYFLTNAQNWYVHADVVPEKCWEDGFKELQADTDRIQPVRILAFGNVAAKAAHRLTVPKECKIYEFVHPSYIVRFNKDRKKYIKEVQEALA